MIDAFRFGLAHPKMLGSLILDKTIKPVLILISMYLIIILTMLGMNYKNIYLTNAERSYVASFLISDVEQDLKFKDNKLEFVEKQYEVYGFNLQFGETLDFSKNAMTLVFTENSVKSYYYNYKVSEKAYSEFNVDDFSVNSINKLEIVEFQEFIQASFSLLYPILITSQTIFGASEVLFSFLMCFLLVFLFTNGINRQVLGVLRIRLLLYSFISYFFIEWLYVVFESSFLSLLAYLIPLVYFTIALRNIVSVKKNPKIESQ